MPLLLGALGTTTMVHVIGDRSVLKRSSFLAGPVTSSAKINISYSILFNLTTSYSSYFGGKKGISRNKTSFFLLMFVCVNRQGMVQSEGLESALTNRKAQDMKIIREMRGT